MGSHIDCMNLVLSEGDESTSYYCFISGEYFSLDYVDNKIDCLMFDSIWVKENNE
jgi:hypothetical protein